MHGSGGDPHGALVTVWALFEVTPSKTQYAEPLQPSELAAGPVPNGKSSPPDQ